MGYTIRLFTKAPLGSLVPLQAQMIQRGYHVQPAGTNQMDIFYTQEAAPLVVDLVDAGQDITRREIQTFLQRVSALGNEPDQGLVLDVLTRTQAIIMIGVPDDYDNAAPALDDTLDIVSNAAEGLFQVDGEGFYDGNRLILPLA
ncbi:MAG: hypothetical protein ACLFTK_02715 [Anaerolineales bacterium]